MAGKVENGGAVYICTQFPVMAAWQEVMIKASLKLKTPIVWDRKHHTAGDHAGDYGNRVELILFGHKGRHVLRNGRQSNLWSISRPPAGEHPMPNPVELMSRCIVNSTDPEAVVLDPFMGSGTTGVAALPQGRRFIGGEICERYFDIAMVDRSGGKSNLPICGGTCDTDYYDCMGEESPRKSARLM